MSNGKSIFVKYFVICSAVILISFICLGAVLLLVSSHYFLEEKKNLLEKNAVSAAEKAQAEISASPTGWKKTIEQSINELAMGSSNDFLITDKNGEIIIRSDRAADYIDTKVSTDLLSSFDEKASYTLASITPESDQCHIVGIKFSVNGPEYYVLAMTPKQAQDDYTWQIMRIFIISMVIVFIASVIVIYFIAARLSAPIRQIAEVSREIGRGNFSVSLPSYNVYEMQELSNAFNEMAVSIKNYDTMRNSFVANVSHELRTPMTSIGGFIDGILDGTIPPEKERHYLKVISSEVSRLTRLVRSMLNLAKIEAGELKPNMTRFSVLEPIVDTLVTFETRLEEKQIEIRGLDTDRINLYADNDLIHQVMYNLIENAIKFVDVGGYIEFSFPTSGT